MMILFFTLRPGVIKQIQKQSTSMLLAQSQKIYGFVELLPNRHPCTPSLASDILPRYVALGPQSSAIKRWILSFLQKVSTVRSLHVMGRRTTTKGAAGTWPWVLLGLGGQRDAWWEVGLLNGQNFAKSAPQVTSLKTTAGDSTRWWTKDHQSYQLGFNDSRKPSKKHFIPEK